MMRYLDNCDINSEKDKSQDSEERNLNVQSPYNINNALFSNDVFSFSLVISLLLYTIPPSLCPLPYMKDGESMIHSGV